MRTHTGRLLLKCVPFLFLVIGLLHAATLCGGLLLSNEGGIRIQERSAARAEAQLDDGTRGQALFGLLSVLTR